MNTQSLSRLHKLLSIAALSAVGLAAATQAQAQEVGRVISTTALITQVSVPRQVCAQEVVQVQNQTQGSRTGGGALIGGIAGAALGNAMGQGNGRAVATALGIFGGAILGDKIEGGQNAQAVTSQQTVNRCQTQNFLENRTTGYQVVYEYAGKQYSVQMPNDPGPSIQLQVSPVQATQPTPHYVAPRVVSQVVQPTVVVEQAPVVTYVQPAPMVVSAPNYFYPVAAAAVVTTALVVGGGYGHRHGYYVRPGHYGHWR